MDKCYLPHRARGGGGRNRETGGGLYDIDHRPPSLSGILYENNGRVKEAWIWMGPFKNATTIPTTTPAYIYVDNAQIRNQGVGGRRVSCI